MQDYEKAKCLLTSGELEEACHLLTNFIESHKDSTEHRTTVTAAYNSRGHAKYLSVDFPGAIEDYSVAIQRDPHFTIAWYNRGQVHYRLGELSYIIIIIIIIIILLLLLLLLLSRMCKESTHL